MKLEEFHAAIAAQGVPRESIAMKCPACGTVQTLGEFRAAVAAATPERIKGYFGKDAIDPELHFGFDCIGRLVDKPTIGCDWTLGGFLKAHTLEVIGVDGEPHPMFEPATPEEAQAHHNKEVPT
jgi:hypothetical protein